tara:strand:+ start:553 stop:831 length:279 start_codon:yes stop_codon:yes gene_type:complete
MTHEVIKGTNIPREHSREDAKKRLKRRENVPYIEKNDGKGMLRESLGTVPYDESVPKEIATKKSSGYKGLKKGGKVRGAGIARKGIRPAKMR